MAGAPESPYVRLEETENLRYKDSTVAQAGGQGEFSYCILRIAYVADGRDKAKASELENQRISELVN
jgi:hypothetical protein